MTMVMGRKGSDLKYGLYFISITIEWKKSLELGDDTK